MNTNKKTWGVRFVPLIGEAGWEDEKSGIAAVDTLDPSLSELTYQSSEHFASITDVNLDNLLQRIGDNRLVLIGEAYHGTAEFYDMRAHITQELIEKKDLTIVAVEADWPDASHIIHYIHHPSIEKLPVKTPFTRFPSWMWATHCVLKFNRWLKAYNQKILQRD
jgi:erythromycin esterase-like protein